MAAAISLAAEPVFHLGHLTITNSMIMAVVLSVFLLVVGMVIRLKLQQVPKGGQSLFELIYDGYAGIVDKVTGNPRVTADLFPFVITAFLFILLSNWSGLIPGLSSIGVKEHGEVVPILRAPTSDLNVVIALAICSVAYIQYLGVKYRGLKGYLSTFFNFSSPIFFFVGLIELVSEFMRIISYSFRLFGNVFAGEVLIGTIIYLTATLAPVFPVLPLPFYFLEMFVGIIQALVFCFLTTVFAGIATTAHAEHAPEAHPKVEVKQQVTA